MAQHDYVIDNSTGANVRADINNALLAISSNNSGSSAPSTTYALQTFANTTDSMLQLRNAANNAFVNLRKFDGTLPLPDGSVSSPSLFFDDDTNTGIFSSAADHINFSCGGSERLELASGGVIFNEDGADVDFRIEGDTDVNLFQVDAGNDRVGISTATPQCLFDVAGKVKTAGLGVNIVPIDGVQVHVEVANPRMMLKSTGTNAAKFMFGDQSNNDAGVIEYAHDSNSMMFSTGTLERVRIDSSGQMMIGTTTANALLDVNGQARFGGNKVTLDTDGSMSGKITNSTTRAFLLSNTDVNADFFAGRVYQIEPTGKVLIGGSAGTNPASYSSANVIINPSGSSYFNGGDVGIGTTGPESKFAIKGSSGDGDLFSISDITVPTSGSEYGVAMIKSNAAAFMFNVTGYNSNSKGIRIYNNGGSTGRTSFEIVHAAGQRFLVDGVGNVAINTSSATAGGNSYRTVISDQIGSGEQLLGLQYEGNVTYGINAEQNSDLTIKKDGTERLRISSVGRVMINTTTIADSSSAQMAILAAHPVTPIEVRQDSAQNHFAITFRNSNGLVGSCRTNGSATFFDTSSDYRLKENAVAISNGITRLKTLKPYRFNFKADPSTTFDGFFAHEVSATVPEAINGTKDEVDKDNNPVYQSIDQSRLVPLLVAAVQELITKVETLEAA